MCGYESDLNELHVYDIESKTIKKNRFNFQKINSEHCFGQIIMKQSISLVHDMDMLKFIKYRLQIVKNFYLLNDFFCFIENYRNHYFANLK